MSVRQKFFHIVIVFFILLITGACASFNNSTENTDTETVTLPPTETKIATVTSTKTPVPTKTEIPTATETTTPELTYRWPAYPDSTYIISDREGDEEWDEIAQKHASNLAVPAPFHYEFYELPRFTLSSEVEAYVKENCFGVTIFPGKNNIMLYRGLNTVDGFGRVGYRVQHWVLEDLVMIIYYLPDEGAKEN